MLLSFERFVGLRYSFSRQRNRFTAVVAAISLFGMAIGVASLIAVLSVMNGFAAELQWRVLSLIPHGSVKAEAGSALDWPALAVQLEAQPGIVAVAPFIETKALLRHHGEVRGVQLLAIEPTLEPSVSRIGTTMVSGELQDLSRGDYGIVVGRLLAQALGVSKGDSIELTLPRLTITPLGTFPRTRRFTVVGIFEVGAQQDLSHALIQLSDGQRLLGRAESVDGLRLAVPDPMAAPEIIRRLRGSLSPGLVAQDWSQTQGSLFQAIKMEKVMVSVLLFSVVAVAAFNIVSTLSMSVAEKRGDIAVLRTLGSTPGAVRRIFLLHGLSLALLGITLGVVLGCLLATYLGEIVAVLEGWLGARLFDPSVYFISDLPSILRWQDVLVVTVVALALALLATLYPASRAAAVAPAEVLRYVQ